MRADVVTKEFMSDTEVFADVFNYYVYGGQQVIRPDELTECDSTELALPYGIDGAMVPVEKYRDKKKLYTAMTDGKAHYVLCGIENQTEIHYAMAVKNSLYDALCYAGQVKAAASSHRKAMKLESERKKRRRKRGKTARARKQKQRTGPDSGEFLGGFWKKDKLIPSVTLTVYFGSKEWDGPMSLLDMLEETDPRVLSCVDDYHVKLIAPAAMEDEEIRKFRSSLREVLLFIKYSEDKEKLGSMLDANKKRFESVERGAVEVIEVITNIKLNYKEEEEVVDVCLAIQEMKRESEMIGRRQGRKAGRKQGRKQGALEQARESAKNFYGMGLDATQIAQGVGYPVSTVRQWLELPEREAACE